MTGLGRRNPGWWLAMIIMVTLGQITPVLALSLDEAKNQGLVGEQPNGYLGIVTSSASSEVRALLKDINRQRREKYEEIAARNKTSLEAVELLAGKTAISKTRAGRYVRMPSGDWVKK